MRIANDAPDLQAKTVGTEVDPGDQFVTHGCCSPIVWRKTISRLAILTLPASASIALRQTGQRRRIEKKKRESTSRQAMAVICSFPNTPSRSITSDGTNP
jgi:hypothetical protein